MSDTNKHFKFDLDRKLKFLDMVTERQIREDHNVSAISLIYSIFSNRNQISLFSHRACDKVITMTGKKDGVPVLVGEL